MTEDYIEVDKTRYPLQIHYERRANARVSIGKKAVYIRLPVSMGRTEASGQIKTFVDWARETIRKNKQKYSPRTWREYCDGETLKIGDKKYLLKIVLRDKKSSSARLSDSVIELSLSSRLSPQERARHTATLLSRCIGRDRLPGLVKKIETLNKKYFRQKIGKIFFKYNKSSWGSCSNKGNINISTRLLFAPDDILEYVCVHELAHLLEMNHSRRFWSLVERALPDYKERRAWLSVNGGSCWF